MTLKEQYIDAIRRQDHIGSMKLWLALFHKIQKQERKRRRRARIKRRGY